MTNLLDAEALGIRLRGYREAMGLSIAQASERSGVHGILIYKLERGEREPGAREFYALCQLYGHGMEETLTALAVVRQGVD